MFSKLVLTKDSTNYISTNKDNQKTFNNYTFLNLNEKKKDLESKYRIHAGKDPISNLLYYDISNPIKIKKDKDNKFRIDKNKLNELFLISEEKRLHKEIYKTELYDLINPYYLVVEKKYIKQNYISDLVKSKFDQDKQEWTERGYDMSSDEFYDKKKKIYFGMEPKDGEYNRIPTKDVIKNAVNNGDIAVRLINEADGFEKILLLKPDMTVDELKMLIIFLYKVKLCVYKINTLSLYYFDKTRNDIEINDDEKTLEELNKTFGDNHEMNIYIAAEY